MNEKLQYADMLEIPVSTTSITYKKLKKKRVKKPVVSGEEVKKELIEKINSPTENELAQSQIIEEDNERVIKPKKTFSIVSLQVCVIIALVAVILISSAVNPNSGINVFLNDVFGSD